VVSSRARAYSDHRRRERIFQTPTEWGGGVFFGKMEGGRRLLKLLKALAKNQEVIASNREGGRGEGENGV